MQDVYRNKGSFTGFLCVLALLTSAPAAGFSRCECGDPKTALEYRDRAYAVFTGKVIDIRRRIRPGGLQVKFQVEDAWKGAKHENITVLTDTASLLALVYRGVTCGYDFEEGSRYLVYAYYETGAHGPARVSRCGGTQPIEEAGEFIRALGTPTLRFPAMPAPPPVPVDPTRIPPLPEATPLPSVTQ